MDVVLLHLGGWDELGMLVGAVAIAFVIVKFTTRSDADEQDEPTADGDVGEGTDSPNSTQVPP